MKKIISSVLAIFLLLGVCACTPRGGDDNQGKCVVWGAPATEKVLKDVSDIYDSFKTDAQIALTVARGEYEGSQIIMSAESDLAYDLVLSELKTADGTVFPLSGIEAFHEKYVKVSANYSNNGMPTGWYPDALIPFAAVKKLDENKVKKGENQGIYFRFNVAINQKPGVYTGAFTLNAGGTNTSIPVSLTVTDATVSETTNSKNIFLNEWSFYKGELDSTQEMLDRYTEAMFEYRISPNLIVTDNMHTDEDVAYYTELAYKYMQNPKCTNIQIPYKSTSVDGETCIDPVVFDKYLTAFAKKSFETGYNMLDKAVCYIGIIDEPQHTDLLDRVKVVSRVFRQQLADTADRIAADASITSDLKAGVVASIRKIRNVVTCAYADSYADHVDTWCPQVQHYDSAVSRENYDSQEEKWWYTCISPRPPYPTYHTEDTLLSARALSWMQAEYGVVGNLFWATDIYASYNGEKYTEIEEYYEGNASRFPNVNGDGYLFYPGKKYGVDGPLGSLRLEAIRDGLEEYELLHALKNKYAAVSESSGIAFDAETMMNSLGNLIYRGTRLSTTTEKFTTARNALLQLAVLAESDASFCLTDYTDDGYGEVTYKFFAEDGAVVKNGGTEIAEKTAVTGGYLYTLKIKLENAINTLDISVEVGGEAYAYNVRLGGKTSVNLADEMTANDFAAEGVAPSVTVVNASDINAELSGKMAAIALGAAQNGTAQSFRAKGKVITGVSRQSDKLVFHLYYDGHDEPSFIISAKHANQRTYVDVANTVLKNGINEVSISLASKNWEVLGDIEYLALYLGQKTGESARTLYLIDSVVYDK